MIINKSESEQQNDTKIQSTNDFNQELDASVSKKASKSSALNSFKSRQKNLKRKIKSKMLNHLQECLTQTLKYLQNKGLSIESIKIIP